MTTITPRSIKLRSDTFYYHIPALQASGHLLFSQWESNGKVNLHFDPQHPIEIQLIFGWDSITTTAPATPIKTFVPFSLEFNGDTKILNLAFVPPFKPGFSQSYRRKPNSVIIENSMVYELVNIVFAITDKGKNDGMTFIRTSPYYHDVLKYFSVYSSHPLLTLVNKMYEPGSATYRIYRESAYNYSIVNDSIIVNGPYQQFEEGNTILDDIDLWQDFIRKTNFVDFYRDHHNIYDAEITLAKKHLPVKEMWTWCESRFSERYQTYRIIISPLVNGFHSTQRITSDSFNECIMFICGASSVDPSKYTAVEREALFSGIVFTEIDHNYINPVSEKFRDELTRAFGNAYWIDSGSQAQGYGDGVGYFNEYMTHAVFLLYAQGRYRDQTLKLIEMERIKLMEWRGFPRFREFYQRLCSLQDNNAKTNLASLYPALIDWGNSINK